MTQHPIAAFLLARYDEAEQRVRATAYSQASSVEDSWSVRQKDRRDEMSWAVYSQGKYVKVSELHEADARHIAAHDPAYVLADIAGKRLIVEDLRWWWDQPDQPLTDAELHARCSHPEWEYATTEGPRKAWDDADRPPEGDGWERNTDAGRDGWERYDHTEESYWRRRRMPEDAEERRAKAGRPPLVLRALALPFAQHADYQEGWQL